MIQILIWRLLDEERFLEKNLPGYVEYKQGEVGFSGLAHNSQANGRRARHVDPRGAAGVDAA
jgi:hypothetical protein